MKIVDLSHPVVTGMQVYPGDPLVEVAPSLTVERDRVNVLSVHIGSQSGTHVDAPFHVDNDLPRLSALNLNLFVGRGVVVDATGLSDREQIPDERFLTVDFSGVSIVAVRTDWSQYYGTTRYFAHPFPSRLSLQHLLDCGIRTIALDFLSLDRTPEEGAEDFTLENHYLWSNRGGVIAENLRNLESVIERAPHFSILPLNLGDSDGAPIRAVAYWAQ